MRVQKLRIMLIMCCVFSLVVSCAVPATPQATQASANPLPTVPVPTEPSPTEPKPTEVAPQPSSAAGLTLNAEQVYGGKFADFKTVEVNLPPTFSGGYTLPVDLAQVTNMSEVELTAGQLQLLSANGFVVSAPQYPTNNLNTEFFQGYEYSRYGDLPAFVTTDSVYHVYHLVFDKMLRDLERNAFIPTLKELTSTLISATTAQYAQLKGTLLEDAALRNVAFFSIAGSLLQTEDPILPEAQSFVEAELDLISGTGGVAESPLWRCDGQLPDLVLIEDYSQYIPRGHYTLSPELEMYFRAMMWYGRLTYRLKDVMEVQRALLITQALRTAVSPLGNPALTMWQNIYDPTVFIVGKADDLGVYEFGAVSDAVFGVNPDPKLFADEALLGTFLATARQLPPPQVNSMWVWIWQDQDDVTQGFRFMGQRFTLDQYVFGQVMWRKVGTMSNPRDLPKALDFFAAQGSELALALLMEMGESNYENYETQMAKVTQEVAQLGLDSWTQNLYWSWLYALQPLFAVKGEAYPAFMQTDAWARKDLQTALSSWTELKHDTILYSKQVMAEMGGGPDDPPPHGYVEPNPEAYARLLALAEMTYAGLESRGLLDQTTQSNLNNLIDELVFLMDISQKELSGVEITDDDYWRIKFYGGWLEAMIIASSDKQDPESYRSYLEDQKSPVVADVATGIERVLEEGVGYPTPIYVVLPDLPYRVGLGMVYTYYEFEVFPGDRMTDETWRSLLESGQAPEQPAWILPIMAD
jgi:hypothetical protein